MENMGFHLLKLSLKKHNDIDLFQSTGDKAAFDCFSASDFADAKRILIIGAQNLEHITQILEVIQPSAEVMILEEDKAIYTEASRYLSNYTEASGYKKVQLCRCDWTELKLDYNRLDNYLEKTKISKIEDYQELKQHIENQCREEPLIADGWADRVYVSAYRFSKEKISTMLLQLFDITSKKGVLVMNTILSDERITKNVPFNYKGVPCTYVPKEEEIVDLLTQHQFHGIQYSGRSTLPIKLVDRVEMRNFLIKAYKGKQGICLEKGHAVFYRGPWKEVIDDDGHKLVRGQRMAVCEKTFNVLTSQPYEQEVIGLEPYHMIAEAEATLFDCNQRPVRHPRVTKGISPITTDRKIEEMSEGNKCC